MKQNKEQEILQKVISKAWSDTSFKKRLIEHPVEVIEELTGSKINLPDGKILVINDQTDDKFIHVNIPPEPIIDEMELSEEQLETIAGGKHVLWNQFIENIFPSLTKYIIAK